MELTARKNITFVIVCIVMLFAAINVIASPELASMLGISSYAAKKVIDIIATASTVWSVIGIVAAIVGTGGVSVAVLATAKTLIKKYGKKWAAAW